jgi:hypothetical protein
MAAVDVGRDHRPLRAVSRPVGGAQSRLVGRRCDGRAALRLLPLAADCSTTAAPTRVKSWTSSSVSSSSDDGSRKQVAGSPRNGNPAQLPTSGIENACEGIKQRTEGRARVAGIGRARQRGDAGVGRRCGQVAAATGTGGVGFASLSPCARPAPPAPVKLVGRLLPLVVGTCVRSRISANKPSRSGRSALSLAAATRPMPQEAREALERALCGVLERRYPGRRFAMKDQLDSLSHRAAAARTTAANTDALKDAA